MRSKKNNVKYVKEYKRLKAKRYIKKIILPKINKKKTKKYI